MTSQQEHQPLILEHTFLATQSTLFDAWITPPVAELWLFQDDLNPVKYFADAKVGGRFHTEQKKDSAVKTHFGKYISIERPNKLVFTLSVPDHFEGDSEVTVLINETQAGTKLTFTQKNADTSGNAKPWKDMFTKLEGLLVQPYLITNASEMTQLAGAINITAMQIAGFLMPLTNEQINQVPFKKSWTPAQLIRHVTKSMSGLGELLGREAPAATRYPHLKILPLKQAFLDITHRMQSPDFIVPEEKVYDKQAVLNDLYTCLYNLNRSADNSNQTGLITGLPLGDVTKLELMHFLLYHTQRHLMQMKRITDAL